VGAIADDAGGAASAWVAVTASTPLSAAQDCPLFSRFPRLAGRVPRIALNVGPSPVSRLARLSAALGRDDIWLKNDGLFGTVYGGNKPRKLQFVLADALRRGARRVLTTGTIGTNHGLATALYAREFGLKTALLLAYEEPSAGNVATLLRMAGAGARIHYTRSYPLTALVAPYYIARYRLRDRRMPYLLGPGGSNALAALGYVDAAFELAEQVRGGELPEPAWIVVPLGTGSTVAGLLAGLRLAGFDTRVLAISATRAPTTWRPAVKRLARVVAQRIARATGEREAGQVRLNGLRIESGWLGPGFGRESAAGSAAQLMLDDLEGLHLDPVYTAKSMSALIDLSRAGRLAGPVLFWHTYNAIPLPEPDATAASRMPASLRRLCKL
jgi:D-cysteine desulfhydrase